MSCCSTLPLQCWPRLSATVLSAGYAANATLQQCFRNFCEFSKNHGIVRQRRQLAELQMNNFQFAHLCKDAGFAEPAGRLHREAIDVIFVRAAPTGKRLISFKVRPHFSGSHSFALGADQILSLLSTRRLPSACPSDTRSVSTAWAPCSAMSTCARAQSLLSLQQGCTGRRSK